MNSNAFALAARFEKPEQILAVAAEVRDLGVDKWDVHTPYPLHGLDDAMGARASRVPWVTFFTFVTVISLVFSFIYWVSVVDYPINIGGKPFYSFFAWTPVLFELSVITSVVATLFGTILFFWKLPFFGNRLAETEYLKATVCDQFGVMVELDSKNFDRDVLVALFKKHGACVIEDLAPVSAEQSELPSIPFLGKCKWREIYFWLALPVIAVVISIKTYFVFNLALYDRIPFIHTPVAGHTLKDYLKDAEELPHGPMTWMDVQAREKTLGHSQFFKDGASMRLPVEGTQARGYLPEAANLENPLPVNLKTVHAGKKYYEIHCSSCHGMTGDGDGKVVDRGFPKPPSLHSEKISKGPDSQIYGIISHGQGNMPNLDKQIPREDRWAIVHYVRVLQRAKNAKDTDVP